MKSLAPLGRVAPGILASLLIAGALGASSLAATKGHAGGKNDRLGKGCRLSPIVVPKSWARAWEYDQLSGDGTVYVRLARWRAQRLPDGSLVAVQDVY